MEGIGTPSVGVPGNLGMRSKQFHGVQNQSAPIGRLTHLTLGECPDRRFPQESPAKYEESI
jgi:hypothetical protein